MPIAQKKRDEMGIKTIPRSEFDRLLPQHFTFESLLGDEVEWFSNRSGNILGTIAKNESTAGWIYAILKLDAKGEFHVRKVLNTFLSLNVARIDLLLSMAGIEKINSATRVMMSFDSFCRNSS